MRTGEVKLVGPARVYLKNADYPGLAMSRSIGDLVAHSVGVSAEPEITTRRLNPEEDSILLLASDGLWEFMSTEEALRIALAYYLNGLDPMQACQELIREAVNRWKQNDTAVDDITCVLVYLRPPPPLEKAGAEQITKLRN